MKKILVIDDDISFGKFLCKGLEKAGFDVEFTACGSNAIRNLDSIAPDMVLTDIVMPNNEGIEIILSMRNSGFTKPIIAMSGFSNQSSSYLEAAELLGANGSLTKPFMIEDLQALLNLH